MLIQIPPGLSSPKRVSRYETRFEACFVCGRQCGPHQRGSAGGLTVSMKKRVTTASCVFGARKSSRKSPGTKFSLTSRRGTRSGKETVRSRLAEERWCENECKYGATSYWSGTRAISKIKREATPMKCESAWSTSGACVKTSFSCGEATSHGETDSRSHRCRSLSGTKLY